MIYDTRIKNLIEKHENQIRAFEQQRTDMLAATLETEKELLQRHFCTYETAPPEVWRIINAMREDFYINWSNDGKLLTELMRRHAMELKTVLNKKYLA